MKLRCENLVKKYGPRTVVKGVSMEVEQGEIVGFLVLDTLAAAINEDAGTIEDVIEPYLIQLGFIARTPRGRVALKAAFNHLGVKPSRKAVMQLSFLDTDGGNE